MALISWAIFCQIQRSVLGWYDNWRWWEDCRFIIICTEGELHPWLSLPTFKNVTAWKSCGGNWEGKGQRGQRSMLILFLGREHGERMSAMLATWEAFEQIHEKYKRTWRPNDSFFSSKGFKVFSCILSHLSSQHPAEAARHIIIPGFRWERGRGRTRESFASSVNSSQTCKFPVSSALINLTVVFTSFYMHIHVSNHSSSNSAFPPVVMILVKGCSVYPVVPTRNIDATFGSPPHTPFPVYLFP